MKTSRSAEQKKYRSQLAAGSVTHTGAAVGFKQQREHTHTHAQNLGDFFQSGITDRTSAVKAEMCAQLAQREKRERHGLVERRIKERVMEEYGRNTHRAQCFCRLTVINVKPGKMISRMCTLNILKIQIRRLTFTIDPSTSSVGEVLLFCW